MADRRLTGLGKHPLRSTKNDQEAWRAREKQNPAYRPTYPQIAPLENLIVGAAQCLYECIHSNGYLIQRAEWDAKTISPTLNNYRGWVYAFYGQESFPVYVGETGLRLRDRFGTHRRKPADWWRDWRAVKVLPCPNQAVRKIFESLAGLAEGYHFNKSQPSLEDGIFDDVICSLLVLGDDRDTPFDYLQQMVKTNTDHVAKLLREARLRRQADREASGSSPSIR